MPSLSPLSTFRPWRMRDGTRGSVTTAAPSAASVGARTTARMTASVDRQLTEDGRRDDRAERDRQGQSDAEQTHGQAEATR